MGNNLTEIEKQKILKEAMEYSKKQMEIPKKKSFNKYFLYVVLMILLLFLFYSFVIFYRHYMFLKMGL